MRIVSWAIPLLALLCIPVVSVGKAMVPEFSESGVPQSQTDILVRLYTTAADKLAGIVLHPPGGTAKAQAFASARAATQLRQITEILKGLKASAAKWTHGAIATAVKDGVQRGDQQARNAGIRPAASALSGSFDLIDHPSVRVIARDMYIDLAKAADSMGVTAAKTMRDTRQVGLSENDINAILAGGVITGQPVQTAKALKDALQAVHGNQVTIIGKSGLPMQFKVGYYAELVAVTKTRQATQAARHERLNALGIDLVSVTGRISKNFCTAYLGQVFSLSGTSDKYPALKSLPGGGPPFHPRCSKSTRPWVEALATPAQLKSAPGVDDGKLRNVDATEAQRRFKDLQLHQQVKDAFPHTAEKLYAPPALPVPAAPVVAAPPVAPPLKLPAAYPGTVGYGLDDSEQSILDGFSLVGLKGSVRQVIAATIPDAEAFPLVHVFHDLAGKLMFHAKHLESSTSRYIEYQPDGPILINSYFALDESIRGGGRGTEFLARQVESAHDAGIKMIYTSAARGDEFNGYITWPKLGYDGPIPAHLIPTLPPSLAGSTMLSDLMATQEGQDWWEVHGETVDLTFDPAPGSPNRVYLDAYRAARANRPPRPPQPPKEATP